MDAVYVSQVHKQLLKLLQISEKDPTEEDLTALVQRYRAIEHQWKLINTEIEHLQERIKRAMQAQEITETSFCELKSYQRKVKRIAFDQLSNLAQTSGIELKFPVTLTQKLQKELGDIIGQLPIEEETTTNWQLKFKQVDDEPEF